MGQRNEKNEPGTETHSDPIRDQVALVNDEDDLLMCLLLAHVLQHALAQRSERIARVKDMNKDVRRVDDLVELAVYPARGALGVDGLDDIGVGLLKVGGG